MIGKYVLKNSYALACPGQGIIRYGYLVPFENFKPVIQPYLDVLDESLQENFSHHLFNKDKNSITEQWILKTSNAQPAILFTTFIIHELIKHEYGVDLAQNSKYLLGHSLGEYTALLLSRIFDLSSILKIVRKRGQLMENIIEDNDYGMHAFTFDKKLFDQVLQLAQDCNVLANINSPEQIVCSGISEEINLFITKVANLNVKSVKLDVKIPFHNYRLKSITEELEAYVNQFAINDQQTPIISNLTGLPSFDSKSTIQNTLNVNYQPVQWVKSINFFREQEIPAIVNMGPGYVLKSLNGKFNGFENVPIDGANTFSRLEKSILKSSEDTK
ncbi:malonyl CoA-acyl carrier protein transacylase [Scheffersomyces coipomensis]|uniref:malonyl CoA-acyl carrier protein transacylase n=1 Tax=Scheffersomyces coipomensis TaxID=1788519 RepID=UPI00315D8E19